MLAEALQAEGFRVVSGGTDTHLMLIDVFAKGILGSEAEAALGEAGITVNKNAIPYDTNPPLKPSGIRIGTPALTTRGMKEPEMRTIAKWIAKALEQRNNPQALPQIRGQVLELAEQFPLYGWLRQPDGSRGEVTCHGFPIWEAGSGYPPSPRTCTSFIPRCLWQALTVTHTHHWTYQQLLETM